PLSRMAPSSLSLFQPLHRVTIFSNFSSKQPVLLLYYHRLKRHQQQQIAAAAVPFHLVPHILLPPTRRRRLLRMVNLLRIRQHSLSLAVMLMAVVIRPSIWFFVSETLIASL